MAVKIRPTDIIFERRELLSVLERNLHIPPDVSRFNWLYRKNPCGVAWAWFLYEQKTQTVVGSASVFPRAMRIGDEVTICGQVGHFSVDVAYRSLGPALLLQRATFEPVASGAIAFCYDTPPHDQGMSTFHRLGMKESCRMSRYARPLRVNRRLERRLGKTWATGVLAALGNLFLTVWDRPSGAPAGIDISLHAGRFDEEFSLLDQQVTDAHHIRSRRSAEDLNWRYREDPLHMYKIFTARRRGELVAFIVFLVDRYDARVVDVFGRTETAVWLLLVEAVAAYVKAESVTETLHALVSDDNPVSIALHKARFSRREEAIRVVVFAQPEYKLSASLGDSRNWSLSYVDYTA